MEKLVTGPLLHLVEEPNTHIFALNNTWLHVIKKLEEFATNAELMMEGAEIVLNGVVSKDEIYNKLLKPTMDTQLEDLTQECLWLLCCSCSILLQRQLQDQLPNGKYYQPSQKIMQETTGVPKQNIISEWNFAPPLDGQLSQKPSAATPSFSGIICFMNNKTPEYLESLLDEEKSKMVAGAIEEKQDYRVKYLQEKKRIREGKCKKGKKKWKRAKF